MFKDETADAVGVDSWWRKSQQSAQDSRACQTQPILTADVQVQSLSVSESDTQTDPLDHLTQLHDEDTPGSPGLRDFLHSVEDMVVKELEKNARSHAFDRFDVNWEDQNQTVSCLHRLQYPEAQERGLHVTSVSWNCTGSVIACAFGRVQESTFMMTKSSVEMTAVGFFHSIDDGDWITERSFICTWNLDRKGLDPRRPDTVIDVARPVMSLSFHPSRPSFIAGGLYSGEVVIWDTSQTQDLVLAQTGMSASIHREPVYQVGWVPGQKKGELVVLSAGSGGKVLLWTVDAAKAELVLTAGYALVRQQAKGSSNVGVTSVALSPWDPDMFLVGSEGGLVLRCSFSAQTPATTPSDCENVVLRAPIQFAFSQQAGPIHSVHCSPFHRNLFLSGGTDGMAHLHSLLQVEPLASLQVSASYVFAVRWSPTRPLIFAAATGQGLVQIFDLGRRSWKPAATIDQTTAGQPVCCLEFNTQQTHLLACGSADGSVNIWHLSSKLTEQGPRETAKLEQLANEVAE